MMRFLPEASPGSRAGSLRLERGPPLSEHLVRVRADAYPYSFSFSNRAQQCHVHTARAQTTAPPISRVARSGRTMPYYEVTSLLSGRLSRRELGELATRTARAFMSLGGTVTRMHALGGTGDGPRQLAYTIRRSQVNHTTGFYLNICAFASPAALKEVCRRLSLDERVLRSLPLRKHPSDAALSPPDVNRMPPDTGVDRNDPAYALHEFLAEYERAHPDGQTIVAAEEDRDVGVGRRAGNDAAVQAVISNLRATTNATSGTVAGGAVQALPPSSSGPGGDPGLRWLLDLDEKKT
jgi:ribosomal protein S6